MQIRPRLTALDLIRIGIVLGSDMAARVYTSMACEPMAPDGRPVDWVEIVAHIAQQQPDIPTRH